MDSHNLSVCVAPSIFHKLDRPSDVESSFQAIAFIKHLIDNCETLFGTPTLSLLTNQLANEHEEDLHSELLDPITTSKESVASHKKQTKSIINHRKEIGRMLNFALKGKKSLKSKTKSCTESTDSSASTTISRPLSKKTAEDVVVPVQQTVPIVVLNSPPKEAATTEDETNELKSSFNKMTLGKEIRRRTSTNNSDQKTEFNAMLVVNVEGDAEDNAEDNIADHIEANQSFNSENDSDQEDFYTYNDDIVSAATGYDCSNDDGMLKFKLRGLVDEYKFN